ncbi:polysaccharide biosynthesis/export family protein, partial [Magnetococcales bacterium HHB-1]
WGKEKDYIYLGGSVRITGNSINLRYLRSPLLQLCLGLIILFTTGHGQTQQDLELLKRLADQQRQDIISEAEPVEVPEEVGPTMTKVDLPGVTEKSSHFGYSFFTPSGSISLLNNLPVPSDYVLGPGDEVVLTLWGDTELVSTHEVSRTGTIYVERVGLVHLAGKTVVEAETFLKGKLEGAYSTLRGVRPKTFFDFSLGELKSINVKFVGEIKSPGLHPVHPFSTVTTGLMQVGGVDTTGSLRDIQVLRNGDEWYRMHIGIRPRIYQAYHIDNY